MSNIFVAFSGFHAIMFCRFTSDIHTHNNITNVTIVICTKSNNMQTMYFILDKTKTAKVYLVKLMDCCQCHEV